MTINYIVYTMYMYIPVLYMYTTYKYRLDAGLREICVVESQGP